MNTIQKDSITDDELFNAYITTPENIRYFISSAKNKISRHRNAWEDECYKLIIMNNNESYPLIIATSQTIVKLHETNNSDELTNYFDNLMLNMQFDFDYNYFKELLTKYCSDCIDNLDKYLFNISDNELNIPANIMYYINRCKTILNKQGNNFENDCYEEINNNDVDAYPVILASCQVIMKVHRFKNIDELSTFFSFIMSRVNEDFMFDNFKNLVLKYSKDYLYIINAYLFDLTDVSNKVKNYIKSK